jgi:hypothetical protein
MKGFYEVANRLMRIKRSNPVVTRVKKTNDSGEDEVFEDRPHVERVISEYFNVIY